MNGFLPCRAYGDKLDRARNEFFQYYGLWAALAFAVLTDVLAALTMGAINWKSSPETFIIAIFVIVGVRVATLISAKITW